MDMGYLNQKVYVMAVELSSPNNYVNIFTITHAGGLTAVNGIDTHLGAFNPEGNTVSISVGCGATECFFGITNSKNIYLWRFDGTFPMRYIYLQSYHGTALNLYLNGFVVYNNEVILGTTRSRSGDVANTHL